MASSGAISGSIEPFLSAGTSSIFAACERQSQRKAALPAVLAWRSKISASTLWVKQTVAPYKYPRAIEFLTQRDRSLRPGVPPANYQHVKIIAADFAGG